MRASPVAWLLPLLALGCHGGSSASPKDAGAPADVARPGRDAASHPPDAARRDAASRDAVSRDVVTRDTGPAKHDAREAAASAVPVDVLTQHNDMARTGQNLAESVLTTKNVSPASFGKLWTIPVQGLVYAQPLVVTGYPVEAGRRDLLLVATMHNDVAAYDANASGPALWSVNLGPSVPSQAVASDCIDGGTVNIAVEVGILATPVVDRENQLLYVTNKTYVNAQQQLWMHALDLATGQDLPGSPVEMTATVPGNPYDGGATTSLVASLEAQRPALLLLNGVAYAGFASHEDCGDYHGWILGYHYDTATRTLGQTAVIDLSLDGSRAGIWQSGQGLASDGTSVYGVTANGDLTAQNGGHSFGEAFLKLSPGLEVEDWFAPVGFVGLNVADNDLGSGGPVLLPGTSPPYVLGGGKEGTVYLVDSASMGHLGNGVDENVQTWQAASGGIFGAPVVWTGGGALRLYLWAEGDSLKEYVFANGLFDTNPLAMTTGNANVVAPGEDPTGILAVSSNGSAAGTGIVWASKPAASPDHATVAGTLYAFDALTLTELWDSQQVPARDDLGSYAKFVAPTVANGKVYLATHAQQVVVYGLLGDAGASP